MRRIHRDVHSVARYEAHDVRVVLQLGLVDRCVVVLAPEALDLFLWKNFTIELIENTDILLSVDLEKEIGLTVDVVGGDPARGRDEQNDLAAAHLPLELPSAHLQQVRHATLQDAGISR